jgi:hypothetical protein
MKMGKKLYSCVNEFLVMERHQFWEGVSGRRQTFLCNMLLRLYNLPFIRERMFSKDLHNSLIVLDSNDCIMSRLKRDVEKMIDICGQLSLPGEADKVS